MKKTNTCCFAGQNPNKLPIHNCSEISADTELKTILFLEIKHLIEKENVTHFISDMELGTDQICAEFVLTLKQFYPHITLECAIPYEEQASHWSDEEREKYFSIIEKCDTEKLLQTKYSDDCMEKCSQYMVEQSKFVLAVWDGSSHIHSGQIVQYAREMERNITIINPSNLQVSDEYLITKQKQNPSQSEKQTFFGFGGLGE